jgi:antitoxin (DNA-binding transcriptional repressor) of toxin-antitoxin stability system
MAIKENSMTTIELDQISEKLPDLLKILPPGEEITITSQGLPVAQLKMTERHSWPSKAGCYQKAEFWMAPDFDAPLDDFREYME